METPPDPTPSQVTWSNEARTIASLLLFAHLFAVVVAVTAYTQPSVLQQRLHELFDPYLRNLHLTAYPISYPFARYHLTHALPSDVDFTCQVQFESTDGPAEFVIPPPGLLPPVRTRRYQLLANAAGALASSEVGDDSAAVLLKAIGGSILERHAAAQGSLKLRAHYVPELDDMPAVDAGRTAPLENYATVYEADVLVSNGQVDILKKSETLEVAPSSARSRGPQPPVAPPGSRQDSP
ncbi:MAG: hypothetical protein WD845_08950 [Pirellulales bacterium]